MLKVLIGDDNREFANVLRDFISQTEGMEVCGVAHNGKAVVEAIEGTHPDVVLLDMLMPQLDGIGVIKEIQNKNIEQPKFVVFSGFAQDSMIKSLVELGAAYFLLKPFDLDVLADRIKRVANITLKTRIPKEFTNPASLGPMSIDAKIAEIMKEVGVPSHIKGCRFIQEAVSLVLNSDQLFMPVTNDIYSKIAAKFKTTPSKTERAIRHAVFVAWGRGNKRTFEKVFGSASESRRPSNSEFIAALVEKIRLEIGA